jgi:hypothetical protein
MAADLPMSPTTERLPTIGRLTDDDVTGKEGYMELNHPAWEELELANQPTSR